MKPFPPLVSLQLLQLHSLLPKTSLLRQHHHHPLIFSLFSPSVTTTFICNSLIRFYAEASRHVDAIKFFIDTKREGVETDNYTYPFVLKTCGSSTMVEEGRMVHGEIVKVGMFSDAYVGNGLLHMYGSCRWIESARKVFDEMLQRDVVTWSSMIEAYVSCKQPHDALLAFRKMALTSVKPNSVTLVSLLSACNDLTSLCFGKSVHTYIVINKMELDVAIGTALVRMYSRCGCIDYAFRVFSSMQVNNLQTWTTMIAGLADHGLGRDAISLFVQMESCSVRPDSVIFSCILSACSHMGIIDEGKSYFKKMVEVYNIKPRMEHYGCMVDMFARAGLVEAAFDFIVKMPVTPNSVIIRSFLGACKKYGTVLNYDEKLIKLLMEIEPQLGANYVVAANVSQLSGNLDDAANFLSEISRSGLRKLTGCSWLEKSNST